MTGATELYPDLLLDHGRAPRNHRAPIRESISVDGLNPICGDRLTVHVALEGERLEDICFEGVGCAISQASASLMTETLRGRTRLEAVKLSEEFREMLLGEPARVTQRAEKLGRLGVFRALRDYPARIKCATLAWHSANAAFQQETDPVSTE